MELLSLVVDQRERLAAVCHGGDGRGRWSPGSQMLHEVSHYDLGHPSGI